MANGGRRAEANSGESVVPASARPDPACTRSYARPATDLANNPSGRAPGGAGGVRSVRDGAERDYPECGWGRNRRGRCYPRGRLEATAGLRSRGARRKVPAQLGRQPPRKSLVPETEGLTTGGV